MIPNADYVGTRVGRWLRGRLMVRRMLFLVPWCLLLSLNTWIPRAIRGLLFITGIVFITWDFVLEVADTIRSRKRRKASPNSSGADQ